MNQKTTQVNNLNIAYLDNEISAEITLIFIHGNSLSSQTFENQFEDSRLNEYRLLALDLPGHGNSDRSPNYSFPFLVETVVQFSNLLNLKNIILVGHSLGGHIAIEAFENIKNSLALIIFGTPPLSSSLKVNEAFLPNEKIGLFYKADLTNSEMEQMKEVVVFHTENTNVIIKSIAKSDPNFRTQLAISVGNDDLKDELQILKNTVKPILILHGEKDPLINYSYLKNLEIPTLWNRRIHTIEGAGHSIQIEKSKKFSKLVVMFVNQLNQ